MVRALIALVAGVVCVILLLPVVAAVAIALGFAASVRGMARLVEPSFVPWAELFVFDRRLGWRPRPHLDTHYFADRDDVFRIVTDGEGWPGTRPLDSSDVVVIGDSFAFGYGIDTDKCFAEVDPALRVKAVGAPGYSMVHGALLMEQFGMRLRGKLVVWFVYLENDLQDNLAPEMRNYRTPFARFDQQVGAWSIVDDHVSPARWGCSNLDSRRLFPRLCAPGPLADRAYSACEYLLDRARTHCRDAGADLVVVTIPHPMQLTAAGIAELAALSGAPATCDPAYPDRRIAQSCQTLGVPMLPGMTVLSSGDYKRREGIHWNQQGHRRISSVLRTLYQSYSAGTPIALPHAPDAPGLPIPNTLLRSHS